jgi:hypothetical protein
MAETGDDILELDSPALRHRTFARLGLLVIGTALALFLTSFLLVSTLASGNLLDLVVLVLWLAGAVLAIGGLGLLAVAGITAVRRRPPFSTLA